jgi:plasmid stabilization system protein ParE
MKFTVIWTPKAEQALAALWLDATDRQSVTGAANRIDRLLRLDPESQGESRRRGVRILFEPPLGALFEVVLQDGLVRVLHVWRFQQHGQHP